MVYLLSADVDDVIEWSAGGSRALLVVGQPLTVNPVRVYVFFLKSLLIAQRVLVRTQPCSLYCVKKSYVVHFVAYENN